MLTELAQGHLTYIQGGRDVHVPTDGWINGGWQRKQLQFHLLAEMLGLKKSSISPDDLQVLFHKAASAKVFAENVQPFLETTQGPRKSAAKRLEDIEQKLGLLEALPFMSMRGYFNPKQFNGVAIWPTGTAHWTKLRLEQIQQCLTAGAGFRHIICLNSSRVCNAPADRRHPLIENIPEGEEPTEKQLQKQLADASGISSKLFRYPELPELNTQQRPLSLQQQLEHLLASGQYDELIGGVNIYVPSTPNSLYVPLHVRRVLGHDDVWFSQAAGRLVRGTPPYWWPIFQDVMTTPNGIIRLWIELQEAGCFTKK